MSDELMERMRLVATGKAQYETTAAQRADLVAAADRIAKLKQQIAAQSEDAARWRETLKHVGGTHTDVGAQRFTLRYLSPVAGSNIMRGSVAGHFTDAIDAALAQAGKEQSNGD